MYLTLFFAFLTCVSLAQVPYNQRYTNSIFDDIDIVTNVVYGNAPAINFPYMDEGNTSPQDLLMDIYTPVGDTLELRPAVICVHSGAFVTGTKEADDMVAFCDSLAHRGYVAASIDYRMGMNIFNSSSSTRAVYRGIQDGRSAIRYLKENAALYGIDTNNIYLLGSSAGAYIGQHNYYMDTEDERPPETYDSPDLGCLDCSGNDFEHNGKANGLAALWGALMDTNLIVSSDGLPVFLAHGTADATVPFGYGSAFGNSTFSPTYGSELVAQQLESFNIEVETYFVFGAGHEFYGTSNGDWAGSPNAYWDSVYNKVESFYYDIHKPMAAFSVQGYFMYNFIDESSSSTSWYWDFGDDNYSVEQNPVHQYEEEGYYKVTQFVQNNNLSWDTVSVDIDFFVGVTESLDEQLQVYPNPASKGVTFFNNNNLNSVIIIFDNNGIAMEQLELSSFKDVKVDVSRYSEGLYFIQYYTGNSLIHKKLIVY
ncbi:MAG: carboxylesterase family protein [Bacteroidota bacterium]